VTTIHDSVIYADGTAASGKLVLTWPPFQFQGVTITGGQEEFLIAFDGTVTIDCYPTAGALPAGVYYTVSYQLDKGPVYEEYWVVPNLPVTTIGAVRTVPGMPQ
jgi:hypothetical protein